LDRSCLNFEEKVRKAFAFLKELGFCEIHASPTNVRYKKRGVEVDVYHGRQSYEVGAGVTAFGARYAISEIIRAVDPNIAKSFRYEVAITAQSVAATLERLSNLMQEYGRKALEGDENFFSTLENQRKIWAQEYSLDVLAEQLRPRAAEAFRRRDYATAADLYSRIRQRLSQAEAKKLAIAEERRND